MKTEKALPARGAKFYFIIRQDIPERERTRWQEALLRLSPLSMWFGRVEFEYSDQPTLINDWRGWNLIKIFCPSAHVLVRPSKAKSFYREIFEEFSTWFSRFCQERRIECKPYDFRILFRLHPSEEPDEFVPIPPLDDFCEDVISPPTIVTIPDPPSTREEMLDFARMISVLGRQAVDELCRWAAEHKFNVYASYGVRTEENANTYELDTLMPSSPPMEAESVRTLQDRRVPQEYEQVRIETSVGPDVVFAYQVVGDRAYLDVAYKGALLALGVGKLQELEESLKGTAARKASSEKVYMEAVGSKLAKLVEDMKRRYGLKVILAGRIPAVWQLRPDLESFYIGLPDDYRLEEAYGFSLKKEPVKITIGKVDFEIVSLAETYLRKMASVLQWQEDQSGSMRIGPPSGRETDLSDLYLITLTMYGEEVATNMAIQWGSYWKNKLPDLYARLRAGGLMADPE